MTLRRYVILWLLFCGFLTYEYAALNGAPFPSQIKNWAAQQVPPFNTSPDPGRPLSLLLGWAGLILMLMMNVYSLRKRTSFMQGRGKLSAFLDFHVFCGLLGPTFIVFHSNFKVRGLVAISFCRAVS